VTEKVITILVSVSKAGFHVKRKKNKNAHPNPDLEKKPLFPIWHCDQQKSA
jgi:hypothetical protein